MNFNFNPNILKNYTLKQLEQLSRAGGTEDVGSTSAQYNAAASAPLLTHSGIFSRLLGGSISASSESTDLPNFDNGADIIASPLITDLDHLTNNEDQLYSEHSIDEDSRSSAVDVEWGNRPERADHEEEPNFDDSDNQHQLQPVSECSFGGDQQSDPGSHETDPELEQVEQDLDPDYQPDGLSGDEQDDMDEQIERTHRGDQFDFNNSVDEPEGVDQDEFLDTAASRKDVAVKHQVRDPCNCKRLRCYEKISSAERQQIWREFWALDYQSQRLFLAAHMSVKEIKQRRPRKEEYRMRNASYTYHFGSATEVCKKMFLATLGFRSDKVLTVCRSTTTVVDQRGKSKDTTRGINRNPMSNVQLEAVKAHIKSFNPGISHYRRKHAPHRLYLDPSLTIQDMFRD